MEYGFGEVTVACSNVDRVMFSADGIAKGELLAYYHDVAPLMVPELSGRPLSVVRYTKGIDRGGFFQTHTQKHFPAWIDHASAGTRPGATIPGSIGCGAPCARCASCLRSSGCWRSSRSPGPRACT